MSKLLYRFTPNSYIRWQAFDSKTGAQVFCSRTYWGFIFERWLYRLDLKRLEKLQNE
jgi:hypothetical protein